MKKLIVRSELCNGCKRCELACMTEHSESKNYAIAKLTEPEPQSRIFIEIRDGKPVPIVCRHCTDALCVSACMAGCMKQDAATGVVTNTGHEQSCVGCWMCIMACPYGVISPSLDVVEKRGRTFPQALKCDLCPNRDTPACVAACPMGVLDVEDVPAHAERSLS